MKNDLILMNKEGHICTLTINRPEKRNMLSPELLSSLCETLQGLARTDEIRAVVLRGEGEKAFSAGYDIGALPAGISEEESLRHIRQSPLDKAIEAILNYPYPVIAMLNGAAFGGGCELAACCDLRVAADDIVMGMTPAKLGVVYSLRGLMRFVQNIGLQATRELFYTGRRFNTQRLKELGLVDYAVPRDQLTSVTYGLAEEIAGNAPLSVKGAKRILDMILRSIQAPEDYRIVSEKLVAQAFASEDLKEGQRAFREKRKPIWKGR